MAEASADGGEEVHQRAMAIASGFGFSLMNPNMRLKPQPLALRFAARPLRRLWGQGHLWGHFDAHTLVVVQHLLRGDAAGFETDAHHLRHFTLRRFLEAVGVEHHVELFERVRTAIGNSFMRWFDIVP